MCGINGIISAQIDQERKTIMVKSMNKRLAHRGPDHDGIWFQDDVCLGHRRLSIIDLSHESNQPFISSDGRYVIVYNGELYNYRELKLGLQQAAKGSHQQAYIFRTSSDTEVVLAAYIRHGTKCLDLFSGMFAFAVYDKEEKSLFMARDRMGVKPLYFFFGKEGLVFSSEIRAILHSGIKQFKLNRNVLDEYCMYQSVFAPNTIVEDIHFLEAGHYLIYQNEKLSNHTYYKLKAGNNETSAMPYDKICERIRNLLAHSVERRMISDVPFGAFLSGGIDSSCVVGLMAEVSTSKINTFNVSFDESAYSESSYAKIISEKFNTQHHEIRLKPENFLKDLPEALAAMDHPSGDGPNTYVVSKATKAEGITMALSGIGGDELFAGYDVFRRMLELEKKSWLNAVPLFGRKAGASLIRRGKNSISRLKIAELLEKNKIGFNSAYPLNRSLFTQKELNALMENVQPFRSIENILKTIPQVDNFLLSAVSIAEMNTYLQHTLLRDTDQMSMAVALEVREPFLDHQLVEFVLSVNDKNKYPHTPKKLLVDSVGTLLPQEIVNRKKMGFVLPWQIWLKTDLRAFCETKIGWLESKNIFREGALKNLWLRFLSGDPLITWARVWHLIVLSHWMENNGIEN